MVGYLSSQYSIQYIPPQSHHPILHQQNQLPIQPTPTPTPSTPSLLHSYDPSASYADAGYAPITQSLPGHILQSSGAR